MLKPNRWVRKSLRWMFLGSVLTAVLLLAWGTPAAAETQTQYNEAGLALAATATATSNATSRIPTMTNATALPQMTPMVVATARPDGSVVHVVGYGQTLYSIALAYGVQIDEIRRLNGMAADSNSIYANQKLLIRAAGSVTPNPSQAAAQSTAPAAGASPAAQQPQGLPTSTLATTKTAAAPAPTGASVLSGTPVPTGPAVPAKTAGESPISPWVAGGLGFAGGMVLMALFQRLYNRLNRSGER